MKIQPTTKFGKISFGFLIAFIVLVSLLFISIASGQKGGEKFSDNWLLAGPGLSAGASGILSFISGVFSIVMKKERAILVLIATLVGAFVVFFISGEILFPH